MVRRGDRSYCNLFRAFQVIKKSTLAAISLHSPHASLPKFPAKFIVPSEEVARVRIYLIPWIRHRLQAYEQTLRGSNSDLRRKKRAGKQYLE